MVYLTIHLIYKDMRNERLSLQNDNPHLFFLMGSS